MGSYRDMNCPECGALNYVSNDPNDPYTHECTVCGALMPMQFKGHNRWDFGVPYEELSQQEKNELHERGRKYDEEQRQKQADKPSQPSYMRKMRWVTCPASNCNGGEVSCWLCLGTGWAPHPGTPTKHFGLDVPCPKCNMRGYTACTKCGGRGKIEEYYDDEDY